jgi:hypothetical protein
VHGLDDKEFAAAWRLAAKCLSPSTPGRSWAAEVWKAACGTDRMAITLADLSRFHRGVVSDGIPARWRDSRGPIGGAFLELKRIGWRFADGHSAPFAFVTDLGDTLMLTRLSPAALDIQLSAAYGRVLERRLAVKLGVVSDYGILQTDLRVAYEPVVRALESAKAGRIGRGVARAFACNAVWTRERLVRVGGLLLDPTCPLCSSGPDTMWHRLWQCSHPSVVDCRNALPRGLVQRALAAGPAAPLYARGWMVHPADVWPRPVSWDQCCADVQFRARQNDGSFASVADSSRGVCMAMCTLTARVSRTFCRSWRVPVGPLPCSGAAANAPPWCRARFRRVWGRLRWRRNGVRRLLWPNLRTPPSTPRRTARLWWMSGPSRLRIGCAPQASMRGSLNHFVPFHRPPWSPSAG